MGIKGLSSLVESEPGLFFKTVKLHDTFLVIDGNCISCWLYRRSCCKSVLNGDYSEYERCVYNFFSVLKQCNIFPVVILDGGSEARKFKRIKERMKQRIVLNQKINTVDFHGESGIPALLTEVFKNCMANMRILFCQSLLEADLEVTKTAQFLNCPVLSFDADFYLDDVDYIPFSTINLQLFPLKENNEATNSKQFIYGKLFDRRNFFENIGHLPNNSFLPLLSFLLGNDYSETETYGSFFSQLSTPKNSKRKSLLQQKISDICHWMQKFGSLEMAVNNFLKQIPAKSKKQTKEELLRCLDEKNSNHFSYIVEYLHYSLSFENGHITPPPAALFSKIKSIGESSEWMKKAVAYILPNDTNLDRKSTSCTAAKVSIPEWILAQHIQGKFQRNLMDLLHSRNFFFPVQTEESSAPSVRPRTLEVLQSTLGIIYHDHPKRDNLQFTLFTRNGNQLGKQILTPKPFSSKQSFTLAEIPMLPLSVREDIAFSVLNIQKIQDQVIPCDWSMFFFTLADWYRADNSQIMKFALGCLIFSSIFVGIIDKKLGYFEEEREFLGKYSTEINNISNERRLKVEDFKSAKSKENFSELNFASAISNINFEDCLLALKQFMPFRNKGYSKQFKKDFDSNKLYKPILHCFAQFQNSVMINEILNSVLDFPFQSLKIADFYCGTLAYNIFFEIKSHKNLQSFIETKFHQIPSFRILFVSAVKVIEKLSNCPILAENSPQRKKNNRNRQRKHHTAPVERLNLSQVSKDIKMSKV